MECSVDHKKHGIESLQQQKAKQKGLKPQKYINLFFAMHLQFFHFQSRSQYSLIVCFRDQLILLYLNQSLILSE